MDNNVALAVFACSNNPPLVRSAAILPCSTGSDEFVSDDLPIFHWRHYAKLTYCCATPCERSKFDRREIRAGKKQRGWNVFEGDGVSPVFCGENGRKHALSYARQRAGYAPTEIRVLDGEWNAVETMVPQNKRGLV